MTKRKEKKILILGGTYAQIPAIKYAKEVGYQVITCDYIPNNPGHKYAHEYYNLSTTDEKNILKLAKELEITGIVAYASDVNAMTAAYVSNSLGLYGASYNSVKILSEKDLFREFLKTHKFNTPKYISIPIGGMERITWNLFPCLVKPVDSSGSKGVFTVNSQYDLKIALNKAFEFSRCKRVIVEEYVYTPYKQLHGDGFVINGELVFLGLGDQHFKNTVPIATTFPSNLNQNLIDKVKVEVARLVRECGFTEGAINVEVRITESGEIFIMEIGPRSGGNYIPQLMEYGTGFNEVAAVIESSMENEVILNFKGKEEYYLQYIIGANRTGYFSNVILSEFIKKRISSLYIHKKEGEKINIYSNSSDVVGVLIVKCNDSEEMKNIIDNIYSHVKVSVV